MTKRALMPAIRLKSLLTTKSLLSTAFLFFVLSAFVVETAKAQSLRWSHSTISFQYEGCDVPDTTMRFWLVNDGSTAADVPVINGNMIQWQALTYPTLPISIKAKDSVEFVLKAKPLPYVGSFEGWLAPENDPSTKITLISRYDGPVLTPSPLTIEIDSSIVGETITREVTLTNEGTRDFTYRSYGFENALTNAQLTGMAVGETIKVGESKTMTLRMRVDARTRVIGTFSVFDQCYERKVQVTGQVVPSGPQWINYLITGQVDGCDTGSTLTLIVSSNLATWEKVDSVRLGPNMEGWSFTGPTIDSFEIKSGNEFLVQLKREPFGPTKGTVILYPHDRPADTARIELVYVSPHIVFETTDDTLYYPLALNELRNVSVFVRNIGTNATWLESIDISENQGWELLSFDQGVRLGLQQRSPANFSFAGTDTPGEYSITFTIRDRVCDHAITQTLIAQVDMESGVKSTERATPISVYPTLARNHITIDASGSFTYSLINVLGVEVMSGHSVDHHRLDVSGLPRNYSYILRMVHKGAVTSRKILLAE